MNLRVGYYRHYFNPFENREIKIAASIIFLMEEKTKKNLKIRPRVVVFLISISYLQHSVPSTAWWQLMGDDFQIDLPFSQTKGTKG